MILAHAGLSDFSTEEWRGMFYSLLLFASLVPAFVIVFNGALHPVVITLSLGQLAGIFFPLRKLRCHLRRYHSNVTIGLIIFVAYIVICLTTNVLFALGLWVFPKIFNH